MNRALLLLALAGCGASEAPECAIEAPALGDGRLDTDGNQLRDAHHRVVMLRGVNAGGRSKFPPYMPFDFAAGDFDRALGAYLDRAASWGTSVLRVPFTWAAVEPTPGADDAAFLSRYDQLLDGAWARGMRTIVDFHQDIYAENLCGDGFPPWTLPAPLPAPHHDCPNWYLDYGSPAVRGAFDRLWADNSTVRAQLEAMWDRMVMRHRDRPGVIGFEILNEPSAGSADAVTFEKTTLASFSTSLAARIHGLAPRALVFFDAIGQSSATGTTALVRPSGERLVFAPHYYQATTIGPLGEGDPDQVRDALTSWASYGTQWNMPLFLGEFGTSHLVENAAEFASAHFAALDALAFSAGTQWEYSTAAETWNAEVFSVAAPDGTEFPVIAGLARPYARAVAGSAIHANFHFKTSTFTLSYVSDGGVTEITLPRDWSSARPAVEAGCVDRSRPNLLLVRGDAGAQVSVEIKLR